VVYARQSRSGAVAEQVARWRLAESTCPAGMVPAQLETTTRPGEIVLRAADFPLMRGLLDAEGRFEHRIPRRSCTGSLSERRLHQTCIEGAGPACEASWERDD
jgi:hypothetical protein